MHIKQRINDMMNKCKENKFYYLCMFLFTILFSLVVFHVTLYADDFLLKFKAMSYDLQVVFHEFKDVYLHWGGGPTPGFAILLLMIGLPFWKVAHILVVFISIFLFQKLVLPKNASDKERAFVSFLSWSFLLLMNLSVSRETLYWFDGAMAYVLTTFFTFLLFYFLYTYFILDKKPAKFSFIFLPILGFFAGWNGPQAGAIAVLLSFVIILWRKFYKKKKIDKLLIFTTIFTTIGFAILYFAPGNNGRMASFEDYYSLNFFGKILYRIPDVAGILIDYTKYANINLPQYLTTLSLLLVGFVFINKKSWNKKRKKLICVAVIIILLYEGLSFLYYNVEGYNVISHFLHYVFLYYGYVSYEGLLQFLLYFMSYNFLLLFLLSILYLSYECSLLLKKPLVFLGTIGGLGTQAMMLFAPYSPFRSFYISIIFFILVIVSLVYEMRKKEDAILFVLLSSLLFYNFTFAIIVFLIIVALKYFKVTQLKSVFLGIIGFLVICTMFITIYGYYQSYKNTELNEKQIALFKENNQEGDLVLYKCKYEEYMFNPLYSDIEWIREDMKTYYGLKEDVSIVVLEE